MRVGSEPSSSRFSGAVRVPVWLLAVGGVLLVGSWVIAGLALASGSDPDDEVSAEGAGGDDVDGEAGVGQTAPDEGDGLDATTTTTEPSTTTTAAPTTTTTEPPPDRSDFTESGPVVIKDEGTVVIENVWISNPSGDCVQVDTAADVVIRNSYIGPCEGRAVWIFNSDRVEVTGSYFEDSASGVYALDSRTIQVTENRFSNTGHHFVQFDKVSGEENKISYNEGENELETSTAVDLINLFQSSGTAESPIEVFENRLRNGGTNGSGSGIMTGDAGGEYQIIRGNLLVNPGQVGIGVAGGSNITVELNRVYSEQLGHTNVGIYVWDQYETNCGGHVVRNNLVNWTDRNGNPTGWWTNGNCGEVTGLETNSFEANIGPEILR